MQTANLRNKQYLRWRKIALGLLLFIYGLSSYGQTRELINPGYDDRRVITYGFLIGIHSSTVKHRYDDAFTTIDFDTVHSIMPKNTPGFSLGFIINMRAADLLDLRITPKVSFYEYQIDYNFTNDVTNDVLVEYNGVVELPFLAKFKSYRRGNGRMYLVGGFTPAIQASGKTDVEEATEKLKFRNTNLSLEFGFGLDLYYPLFKFSPELRYSIGMANMLGTEENQFSEPLKRVNTHSITFYFLFQ